MISDPGLLANTAEQAPRGVFAEVSPPGPLWEHQLRAVSAFAADDAAGKRSTYLVIPPGGGKTMIGLECARQAGRPTLVLCPNTATSSSDAPSTARMPTPGCEPGRREHDGIASSRRKRREKTPSLTKDRSNQ